MTEIEIRTSEADLPSPDEAALPPVLFERLETDDTIELTAEVTGFEPDDIEVVLDGGLLTVSGSHEEEEADEYEEEGLQFAATDPDELGAEAYLGFVQSFTLPAGVTAAQVAAELGGDGVLTIVIAKSA
jgi:HSP20 family molecular chaperone IbpA